MRPHANDSKSGHPVPCKDVEESNVAMSGTGKKDPERTVEKADKKNPKLLNALTLRQLDNSSLVIPTPDPKLAPDLTSGKGSDWTRSHANNDASGQTLPCSGRNEPECAQDTTSRTGPGRAEDVANRIKPTWARDRAKSGKPMDWKSEAEGMESTQEQLLNNGGDPDSAAAKAGDAEPKCAVPCEGKGESKLHRPGTNNRRSTWEKL